MRFTGVCAVSGAVVADATVTVGPVGVGSAPAAGRGPWQATAYTAG